MSNLIQYRAKKKISQRRFAEMIGVNQSTIARYETGDAVPSLETALRIHEATNKEVSLESLVQAGA